MDRAQLERLNLRLVEIRGEQTIASANVSAPTATPPVVDDDEEAEMQMGVNVPDASANFRQNAATQESHDSQRLEAARQDAAAYRTREASRPQHQAEHEHDFDM